MESEKRQERRQRQKERDPEYTSRESQKRQERRLRQKEQDPEYLESKKRKELLKLDPDFENKQVLNAFFDKMLANSTFFSKMIKTRWRFLKQAEIDFLFSEPGFTEKDRNIDCLLEDRKINLEFLQNNLDFPIGRNILFYIETLVHDCKNQRELTKKEKDYVKSLPIEKIEEKKPEICDDRKEYKKQKSKVYYDLKKLNQKTINLNLRFMKEDPNRVLSIDEIINDPFCGNYSQKEAYKIDLWKLDHNLNDLDKWRKEYEDYVEKVEELSIEYKTEFLKNKN